MRGDSGQGLWEGLGRGWGCSHIHNQPPQSTRSGTNLPMSTRIINSYMCNDAVDDGIGINSARTADGMV